jgi:hypothetical protein
MVQDQYYQNLASTYPLLTRDEEVAIVKEIEDGLEAKELLHEDVPREQAERLKLIERQGQVLRPSAGLLCRTYGSLSASRRR